MIGNKKVICIIPARGGSEGLPGKNIRRIAGKPMIAHAIEKALSIRDFDQVVVSTDDPQISQVAKEWGASVPFLRDESLARSDTPMVPVILDVLFRLKASGDCFDYAVMLQANSPLLMRDDILLLANRLIREQLDVVFTVTEASHPPQWTIELDSGVPNFAFHGICNTDGDRRQEHKTLYRSTGAIYGVNVEYLFRNSKTARLCLPANGQRSLAIVTDCFSAVDIDTELDFILAEAIFARLTEGGNE